MNTASTPSPSPSHEPFHAPPSLDGPATSDLNLDQTLTEIRSGRRLEKIVSCIDGFLVSQISRIEKALEECERAVENDKIVQRILADFELTKQEWEDKRVAETIRLREAGDKLIQGWEQLENERREWLDERDGRGGSKKR